MTFMIILGAVAAIYIAILMFRLASVALPLYAGIGTTLYLIDRDLGYLVPIIATWDIWSRSSPDWPSAPWSSDVDEPSAPSSRRFIASSSCLSSPSRRDSQATRRRGGLPVSGSRKAPCSRRSESPAR